MHFIMLYCFYINCLMNIVKKNHSCNLLSYFNDKITIIMRKLIMIAQIKHRRKYNK